ncbi:MAG TPA: O-methyltransferase [Candidatus Acidoferrales bacterium]|nr:O-methyltransferase [Candidatus Acidoferrales bacterium]
MKPITVTDELQDYMEGLLPRRDAVLARMEKEAERENIPIVGPHEGALLGLLVRIAGARRVLELGTATGYSGIWLLRGTEGGELVTYELDRDRAARARENFEAAGLAARVQVREEDALESLERLEGDFDACFHDLLNSLPSERATERSFELCLARLRPGGLLMADNALGRGSVARPDSRQAKNIGRWNQLVARHPGLESVLVPIRDGVLVARVRT